MRAVRAHYLTSPLKVSYANSLLKMFSSYIILDAVKAKSVHWHAYLLCTTITTFLLFLKRPNLAKTKPSNKIKQKWKLMSAQRKWILFWIHLQERKLMSIVIYQRRMWKTSWVARMVCMHDCVSNMSLNNNSRIVVTQRPQLRHEWKVVEQKVFSLWYKHFKREYKNHFYSFISMLEA